MAGGYQQNSRDGERGGAEYHRAERNPCLPPVEDQAAFLMLDLNEITGDMVGGRLTCPPEFQLTDAMIESVDNAVELAESFTDLFAKLGNGP